MEVPETREKNINGQTLGDIGQLLGSYKKNKLELLSFDRKFTVLTFVKNW